MSTPATVYVALLNEAVNVWRPVQAEHLGEDRYRLTAAPPDGEVWPFATSDVVRCAERTLAGDGSQPSPVLVAYEKCTSRQQ